LPVALEIDFPSIIEPSFGFAHARDVAKLQVFPAKHWFEKPMKLPSCPARQKSSMATVSSRTP
jgi:hypothetical protein